MEMGTGLGVFWVCYEICTLLTNEQVLAVYYGWVLGGGEGGLYTTKRALVSKQQVLAVYFGWVLRCVWGGVGGFGCVLFVLQNVHLVASEQTLAAQPKCVYCKASLFIAYGHVRVLQKGKCVYCKPLVCKRAVDVDTHRS